MEKYKSVHRAERRGLFNVKLWIAYPLRPFNNRKRTKGRKHEVIKQRIHGAISKRGIQQ